MKRRSLVVAAAAAALAAVPGRIRAQSAVPIRMGAYPTDTFAEPFFALDTGIFQRAGITVELTMTGTQMQALVADALDVAIGDALQTANPVNAGVPLAIFAGGALYSSNAPTTLLCVAKNSPIRTAKELEGQTIGVVQLSSGNALAVREWMRQNGADLEKVRLVEIPFSNMSAALQRGELAAAHIAEPFLSDARNDVRPIAKAYDAIAKSWYIDAFIAKRAWLEQNLDTARRLTRSIYEAAQWANTHRDESAPILAKWTKIDVDRIRAITRVSFATSLDERQLQPELDAAYRQRLLAKPISASELIMKL